jgi:hypothetical protein
MRSACDPTCTRTPEKSAPSRLHLAAYRCRQRPAAALPHLDRKGAAGAMPLHRPWPGAKSRRRQPRDPRRKSALRRIGAGLGLGRKPRPVNTADAPPSSIEGRRCREFRLDRRRQFRLAAAERPPDDRSADHRRLLSILIGGLRPPKRRVRSQFSRRRRVGVGGPAATGDGSSIM